jgi:hypothetical protein
MNSVGLEIRKQGSFYSLKSHWVLRETKQSDDIKRAATRSGSHVIVSLLSQRGKDALSFAAGCLRFLFSNSVGNSATMKFFIEYDKNHSVSP